MQGANVSRVISGGFSVEVDLHYVCSIVFSCQRRRDSLYDYGGCCGHVFMLHPGVLGGTVVGTYTMDGWGQGFQSTAEFNGGALYTYVASL